MTWSDTAYPTLAHTGDDVQRSVELAGITDGDGGHGPAPTRVLLSQAATTRTARNESPLITADRHRGVVAALSALLAVLAALVLGAGPASAAPANELRSFPGCPLLLEARSSGPCVQALQTYLNIVHGGYGLLEDGQFGASTRIAVLDLQGRNGLPADGNVGTQVADTLLASRLSRYLLPWDVAKVVWCISFETG